MNVKLNFIENGLPIHLGGHENETHIDEGALDTINKAIGIKRYIDVGCGPGGMVELAKAKGFQVLGIDGDWVVERPESIKDDVVIVDYVKGTYIPEEIYDLAWSVEFVEHVAQEYMVNYLETFEHCRYVCFTHAIPGQPGHHHVNCQNAEYWIGVMNARNFEVDIDLTNKVRAASTMKERYIRQTGLVFRNRRFS